MRCAFSGLLKHDCFEFEINKQLLQVYFYSPWTSSHVVSFLKTLHQTFTAATAAYLWVSLLSVLPSVTVKLLCSICAVKWYLISICPCTLTSSTNACGPVPLVSAYVRAMTLLTDKILKMQPRCFFFKISISNYLQNNQAFCIK